MIVPRWIRPEEDLHVSVIIMNETAPDVKVQVSLFDIKGDKLLVQKEETYKSGIH